MSIKKLVVILIFCCLTKYTLSYPADDVHSNTNGPSSKTIMQAEIEKLYIFFQSDLAISTVYYLNNAVDISEYILKDESLIGNNNTVVYEFKQNLTDLVDEYYNLYFEDIAAFFKLAALYSSTTSYYYEIPREQLTADTNLIVSLLKRHGSDQLNIECRKLFIYNFENFVKKVLSFEVPQEHKDSFSEYLHQFKTNLSFDSQFREVIKNLDRYEINYYAQIRKNVEEVKQDKVEIFQSTVKDFKQITFDYVNNAVNISYLVIKDPSLAISTSPELQEFKRNITEFVLNYYKAKQEHELLFELADLYTSLTSHYYYQIANETATTDVKLILNLLEKYGSMHLYEEYNKLLKEFVDKIQDKLLRKKISRTQSKINPSRVNLSAPKETEAQLTSDDKLFMHIFNSYKKITFDYLNNAINNSEQILKNVFVIDNNNNYNNNGTAAIEEFKKYLTEFVYNHKTEFCNMSQSYLTETSKYVQLSKHEPKYSNKLFVKLLNKYKVEQLNMDYEKIVENFDQEITEFSNNINTEDQDLLNLFFDFHDHKRNFIAKVNVYNLFVFKGEDRYIRIMRQQYTRI